jgi:hypothetical protein
MLYVRHRHVLLARTMFRTPGPVRFERPWEIVASAATRLPPALPSSLPLLLLLTTAHCSLLSQLCLPQHLTHCIAKPLLVTSLSGERGVEEDFRMTPKREQDLSALNHLGTVLATVRLRGLYCILCTSAAYCTLHFTAPRCCWQQCRRLPNCAYSACPRTSPLINGYRQHTIADEDAMTWRLLGL